MFNFLKERKTALEQAQDARIAAQENLDAADQEYREGVVAGEPSGKLAALRNARNRASEALEECKVRLNAAREDVDAAAEAAAQQQLGDARAQVADKALQLNDTAERIDALCAALGENVASYRRTARDLMKLTPNADKPPTHQTTEFLGSRLEAAIAGSLERAGVRSGFDPVAARRAPTVADRTKSLVGLHTPTKGDYERK